MGSKDKFYGIISAAHGFDDIGFNQTSGTINSVAKYGAGKYAKYAMVTASTAHNLTVGQQINVTGTTDYDGPTRILAIVSSTKFVIKKAFTVTKSGAWDLKQAEGNWDALMPVGADQPAANVAITFWKPEQQGGNDASQALTKDKVYVFPGGIRKIILSSAGATAGDIRLFRAASTRPGAVRSLVAPSVVGYNPTGGTAGDTVDIIGSNFDRALSNNVVKFFDGTTAAIATPLSIDQEGHVLTVTQPSLAGATGVVTVTTNGLATATGPAYNGH